MTDQRGEQDALLERIHGFIVAGECNELSDDRWRDFEQLLRENDEACRLYAEYMDVSIFLPAVLDMTPNEESSSCGITFPEPPAPTLAWTPGLPGNIASSAVSSFSSGWAAAYLAATAILGFGLLIASLVTVSHPVPVVKLDPPSATLGTAATTESVGRITGMVDCVWDSGQRSAISGQKSQSTSHDPLATNHSVALGDTFVLRSGLLEITYNTGARVILQGPVTYEIDAPTGGFLSVGKLTARLEKKSLPSPVHGRGAGGEGSVIADGIHHSAFSTQHLFSVRTPTALVTDLGTEFGVEVKRDGESGVQVFQGTVRLSTSGTGAVDRYETLEAGKSMWVKRGQQPGTYEIVAEETVRGATPFVRMLPARRLSAYGQMIMIDKPRLYWSFDELKGPAYEQVRQDIDQRLYPVAGATRSDDTPTGKGRAADFTRSSGCFRSIAMHAGAMSGPWGLEFWTRFSGPMSDRPFECLMNFGQEVSRSSDSWNPAVVSNFGRRDDCGELALCFQRQRPTANGPKIGDDRWHHLMFVFFGNKWGFGVADRVDVVFDGEARSISRQEFTSAFDLDGRLALGAADLDLASPFHGLIDELALYDFSGLNERQVAERAAEIARRHFRLAESEKAEELRDRAKQKSEVRVESDTKGR
jgi:hypothetical protein